LPHARRVSIRRRWPLLRIWDWKADPPRIPGQQEILVALEISGWDKVQRRPPRYSPADRRDGN